ncbi:hypothetical protein QQF64_034239 [Cirrhinus molitorella]|uniref:Uncharacterized protein n=1 Tax=Cirrhinus molitorella TaxID=172907 RepID=A0ABR3MWA2_9TELE
MITGFVPEYQHSVCLGITKQITSLWLDSKHHNKDRYLGLKINDIDQGLMAINPPLEVTKAPRSVKERKFWKASEWSFSFCKFLVASDLVAIQQEILHLGGFRT